MVPWQTDRYRGWMGMGALVALAIGSIIFSVWGILGFRRPDFFVAATPKTTAIILSIADCKECASPEAFLSEFETQGFVVTKERTVAADSREGKELIANHEIEKLPTIILDHTSLQAQEFLKNFGTLDGDTFVLRNVVPPYRDVASGSIKGRFGITLITDKSCAECYDVQLHKTPLSRLGMTASDEKIIDVGSAEGKQLVEKYKIETVPTLIMQGELSEYTSLNDVWSQVGTVESDGAYVFRSGQDSMGTYRVLKTKEIKKVTL